MQVQMLAPQPDGALAPSIRKLPGPIAVLTSVIRTTGFRGLWLGHTGTFIREGGGTAAWFATKEFVASQLVARRQRSTEDTQRGFKPTLFLWESAFSGACAGAAFNLSLFPADTVKSAMQTEEELRPRAPGGLARPPPTFWGTFLNIYRARGFRGFYAGCGITVARSLPSSGIIFLIYDGLCRRFG
jgi:ornithine carrier protein